MGKKKPPKPIKDAEEKLLDEVQAHESDSKKYLSTRSDDWDNLESMLLGKLEDKISEQQKSQVFNPVLASVLFERAAKVMAQNLSGKAFAVSKDDKGKNLLMNLALDYFKNNANEQYSHLLKQRMMGVYSGVFGSSFGLVPWRVNSRTGYIGPELLLIDIRNIRPQPMKRSIDDSDWFGVRDVVTLQTLERWAEDMPEVWKGGNIKAMARYMKEQKSEGDTPETSQDRSYVARTYYPSIFGDAVYPPVELFTEYRQDKWITWAPKQINTKTARPYIVRVVENPYPDGMLPVVQKDAFPLMDSIIGLGDFERGKTLQFALNSLINLYLAGVKYSIFPPLHINLDEVTPSSIKWGAGERWFMDRPNQSVQAMQINPQGLKEFQSTYSFMLSAVYNLAGTAQVSIGEGVDLALGKTPEALRQTAAKESARDEWERFQMETTIDKVYTRWIALTANNMTNPQIIRLYEQEIEEIKELYPNEDILEEFGSGKRGNLKLSNKQFIENGEPVKFDFEVEPGSSMRKSLEDEATALTSMIKAFTENPNLLEEVRMKGKDVDMAELLKRWMIATGVKDWDKIIIEGQDMIEQQGGFPPQQQAVVGQQAMVEASQQQPQVNMPQFNDEDIAATAQQIFGGIESIPRT